MKQIGFFLILISHISFAQTNNSFQDIKISEELSLVQISKNCYIHKSMLTWEPYGKFSCNGLVYIKNKEAIIADTPAHGQSTQELLDWFEKEGIQLKAVIVNHFHADCLIGLPQIHKKGINSYGTKLTVKLAQEDSTTVPNKTFKKSLKLKIGDQVVIAKFLGEAHTKDNIAVWIPEDKVLFGGCMVKSMKAGKGNVADANVDEWSNTVEKVKNYFSEAQIIIPGHGSHGGIELLDKTIKLFKEKEGK